MNLKAQDMPELRFMTKNWLKSCLPAFQKLTEFYHIYEKIRQTVSDQSQKLCMFAQTMSDIQKSEKLSRISECQDFQEFWKILAVSFLLSCWSHYVVLMTIK